MTARSAIPVRTQPVRSWQPRVLSALSFIAPAPDPALAGGPHGPLDPRDLLGRLLDRLVQIGHLRAQLARAPFTDCSRASFGASFCATFSLTASGAARASALPPPGSVRKIVCEPSEFSLRPRQLRSAMYAASRSRSPAEISLMHTPTSWPPDPPRGAE